MHLEVFLAPALTDTENSLEKLIDAVKRINPTKVQLNTLDRPGTDKTLKPADFERADYFQKALSPFCDVEIVGKFKRPQLQSNHSETTLGTSRILEIIKRRPCTLNDLETTLNIEKNKLKKQLNKLLLEDKIIIEKGERGTFYRFKE